MPNLKVTENYLKEQNFQLGANSPLKTWDFPDRVLSEEELQTLLYIYDNCKGTLKAFWMRDPFDYDAPITTRLTGYQSATQGIAIKAPYSSSLSSPLDRVLFYKAYGINTARGWKYFLRYCPRPIDGTAKLLNISANISAFATPFPDPYTSYTQTYFTVNPANYLAITREATTPYESIFYPAGFEFYTPVRFTQAISYKLIADGSACRYYQVSGIRLQEVLIEHPESVKAGFIKPTQSSMPGSTSQWNCQQINS